MQNDRILLFDFLSFIINENWKWMKYLIRILLFKSISNKNKKRIKLNMIVIVNNRAALTLMLLLWRRKCTSFSFKIVGREMMEVELILTDIQRKLGLIGMKNKAFTVNLIILVNFWSCRKSSPIIGTL